MPGNEGPIGAKGHAGEAGLIFSHIHEHLFEIEWSCVNYIEMIYFNKQSLSIMNRRSRSTRTKRKHGRCWCTRNCRLDFNYLLLSNVAEYCEFHLIFWFNQGPIGLRGMPGKIGAPGLSGEYQHFLWELNTSLQYQLNVFILCQFWMQVNEDPKDCKENKEKWVHKVLCLLYGKSYINILKCSRVKWKIIELHWSFRYSRDTRTNWFTWRQRINWRAWKGRWTWSNRWASIYLKWKQLLWCVLFDRAIEE